MAITTPRVGAFATQDGGQPGVNNTMTVPRPSTVNVGELLVIHAMATSIDDDPQAPAGWVEWRNNSSGRHRVFAKIATAAEATPGGADVDLPFLDVNMNLRMARMLAIPGTIADVNACLDGTPQIASSATDIPYNALTVTTPGCIVLIFAAASNDTTCGIPNTGSFTELYDANTLVASDGTLAADYWIQTTPTSVIAGTITTDLPNIHQGGVSIVLAIKPSAATLIPGTGSAAFSGKQAVVTQANPNKVVTPSPASLTFIGQQVVRTTQSPGIQGLTGALTLQGRQPSVGHWYKGVVGLPPVPAGFQYITIDTSSGIPTESVFFGATPAVATGDIAIVPLQTPTGYAITLFSNGLFEIAANGDGARQQFALDVWDVSLAGLYGSVFIYVNNTAPNILDPTNSTFICPLNVAVSVDMSLLAADLEGAAILVTKTSSANPEIVMGSSTTLSFTPVTRGIFVETFNFADDTGENTNQSYVFVCGNVAVPLIIGSLAEDIGGVIAAAYLEETLSPSEAHTALYEAGVISLQSPAAGTLVPPGTILQYTISLGEEFGLQNAVGGGHAGYSDDDKARRRREEKQLDATLRSLYRFLFVKPGEKADAAATTPDQREVSPPAKKPARALPRYVTPDVTKAMKKSGPAKRTLPKFDVARKLDVKKGSRYRGY